MSKSRKPADPKTPVDNLVRVAAMMRSGHHAVILWLLGGVPDDEGRHFNDIDVHRPKLSTKRSGLRLRLVTVNFEDYSLYKLVALTAKGKTYSDAEQRAFAVTGRRVWMQVIRDPYNMFASRLSFRMTAKQTVSEERRWISKWIEYANEHLGITKILTEDSISVDYNRWFLSEEYRRGIMGHFGLELNDRRLNVVPGHGSGSSFDKTRFNGNAQQMKVLERWKKKKDHPYMIRLMKNEKVRELARRIWTQAEGLPG